MTNDVIQGAVKVVNLPDLACFTNFEEFVQALANSLVLEIPQSITNVVDGNSEPTSSQTTVLWVRRDNSGTFVGLYVFTAGSWTQIYPVPGQLTRVYGSTLDIPEGFQRADQDPNLTVAQRTFLQGQWMPDPGNPGEYLIFDVTTAF